MANPWDGDPIVSASPAAPWASDPIVQAPRGIGEHGYAPAPEPAPPPAAAAPGQRTGLVANIGAGLQEGAAGAVNALSDPSGFIGKQIVALGTGAYNLGARALGKPPMDPKLQNLLLDDGPGPGDRFVAGLNRAGGAPAPDQVQPADGVERYVRAGAQGVGGMLPFGPVNGLARLAGTVGVGTLAGVGGQAASDAVPDDLKPAAGLLGGIIVPGAAAAGVAGLRAAVRPATNALADFRAPITGQSSPLLDQVGQPLASEGGNPLAATPGQARLAGERVTGMMSDPAAVQAALDAAPPTAATATGAPAGPTAFQVTRDPALGQNERSVSRTGPDPQDFRARQDAQNDLRVQTVQGIAAGADPAAVPAFMRGTAADLLAQHDAEVARTQAAATQRTADVTTAVEGLRSTAQQRATRATDAIGGNLPAGADNQVGAALRAPLDAASQAVKSRERALWDAVDPNGTLAVDMRPVKQAAAGIVGEMSPNAASLAGNEAGVFKTAGDLPDTQSFRDLAALRSRLTDAIRNERGPQGDPQAVRRMSQLLDGVHNAMAGAANDAEIAPAAGERVAPPSAPDSTGAPATGTAAYTPSGRRVDVRYRVREASDLTASQLTDGRDNPAYPAELQPRDRTRAASTQQVNGIASRLEPERLGPSASTAEGAPIVGPDGIVESGNGRTMAIQQAHAQGGERSQAYRDYLTSQGYDVSGMKAPVLVRERVTDVPDRARFAADAGASPVLSMSASERAAADAKMLPSDIMSSFRGGDVTDARNTDFARAFAQHVVPPGEQASFITANGKLSVEGAARVQNALTQHAYGSNTLVSALAEHADENVRNFGGAMADASGPMAKLRSAIDSGAVSKGSDLAPSLVEAANLVQDARKRGISLADAVSQQDAFSQRGPMVESVLRAAYGDNLAGRMSRGKLTDLLGYYADEAQQQAGLFGENRNTAQMLGEASQKYGYGTKTGTSSRSGATVGDGPSVGQDRNQARGPVDGTAGEGNASAGAAGGDAAGAAPQAALTPNFDAAAAERYAAARQATRDRVATFKNAPGVGTVLQGGTESGTFKAADTAVPNLIVRVGPAGADTAKAYIAAGGTPAALADAAAFSLRQFAMKDGVIDPAKYATWTKDRAAFLSQIPDAAARFGKAADTSERAAAVGKASDQTIQQAAKAAQKTVDDAVAARATAVKAQQDSVAGKFLGDADPVRQVGSILRSPTAVADMGRLAELTRADPEARAGLQRAVAEHILTDLKGNGAGATSAETYLKGDQLQRLIRDRGPALAQIMSPEQMTSLRSVADSLAQSRLSQDGTRVGAGSDTAQNAAKPGSTFLGKLARELSGEAAGASAGATLGAGVGFAVGGPVLGAAGATVGTLLGRAGGRIVQGMREAGLQNVDHLVSQALLNPALMRTLMTTVTPQNQASLMAGLGSQLRRMSLVSAVQNGQRQQGAAAPQNDLAPPAPFGTASSSQGNALLR